MVGWKASFQKKVYKVLSIILKAIASYYLRIWHAFFDLFGGLNDVNVPDLSLVFKSCIRIDLLNVSMSSMSIS